MMSIRTLAPPGAEPVSVAEAKDWLRIGSGGRDDLIAGLIAAARERVETHTGRALIARSLRETLDGWSWRRMSGFGAAFALPMPPLVSVDEIRVRCRDGTTEIWDAAEYRMDVEADPGRIVANAPFGFPRPGARAGGIEIDFTAGYGSAPEDVPPVLREAVMRLAAASWSDGAPAPDAGRGLAMGEDVAALLAPWRPVRL